jgi:hypothetical protein
MYLRDGMINRQFTGSDIFILCAEEDRKEAGNRMTDRGSRSAAPQKGSGFDGPPASLQQATF